MNIKIFDTIGIEKIDDHVIGKDGFVKPMPADFYKNTTVQQRAMFGNAHGIYGFLTNELIQWLLQRIDGRSTIEIGSGSGSLSKSLGIVATDNRMQEIPEIAFLYRNLGQPTVRYGTNVEYFPAAEAVRKYHPQIVIAQWVTHLYREDRHQAGGNMFGVDEEDILQHCEEYIFIGNEKVHAGKSIWQLPHEIIYPDWLYSRAHNGSREFIAVWPGKLAKTAVGTSQAILP